MNLPFTPDQFFAVFERYNVSVWPSQIVLNLLALTILFLSVKRFPLSDKIISGILSFFWIWIGAMYHLLFFASINPAATVFGILNIVQGVVFLYYGFLRRQLRFQFTTNSYTIVGSLLIAYALVIYPALGAAFGHVYPNNPTLGLPCPTTIFTFGILLWTSGRVPKIVLVIPFLWSVVGFSAALTLGVREDIGLLVAGVAGLTLLAMRDRRQLKATA